MAGRENIDRSNRNQAEADPRLEHLIRCRASLEKCLDAGVLVNHLSDYLSPGQREEVKRTKEGRGPTAGARQLLDFLIEVKGPHLFSRLRGILDIENHEQALQVLEGYEMESDAVVFEKVLDLLRPYVINQLGPIDRELTNHLMSGGCISDAVKQRIDRMRDRDGDLDAATELLDQVKRLAAGWPRKFVDALRAGGNHEDLVEFLEDLIGYPPDPPTKEKKSAMGGPGPGPSGDPSTPSDGQDKDDSNEKPGGGGSSGISDALADESLLYEEPPCNEDTFDAPTQTGMEKVSQIHGPEAKDSSSEANTNGSSTDKEKKEPTDEEDGKLDEATGGESQGQEHREKHDTESCKEAPIVKKKLEPRDYQWTLALPGINGENTIICAQTGSGKTVVAAMIMEHHLRQNPKNKVVFVVCDVALANQQSRGFKEFLSDFKTIERFGDSEGAAPIKMLLEENDIIVLTAQLLVNAMNPMPSDFGDELDLVEFDQFTMIIFDECHHCASGHPYNIVMGKYVDMKLEGKTGLPQVLGLTASLGVNKASHTYKAIEHIITMCANLDAQVLSYPDEVMKAQIEIFANTPTMNTVTAPRRDPDPFLDLITDTMVEIEKKLKNVCQVGNKTVVAKVDSPPVEKGIQGYIQWVSEVATKVVESKKLGDLNRQRAIKYMHYLKIYNKGLLINDECRTRDALEYLRQQFRRVNMVKVVREMNIRHDFLDEEGSDSDDDDGEKDADETETDPEQKWLEQSFREQEPTFDEISRDPHNKNPMLELLKERLLAKYQDVESGTESRGIIFVQTREMTKALRRWILEDADLMGLNPELLVGSNNKGDGETKITQSKLLATLKQFKGGVHKVIVATSVAEEGLDIQKCNWVMTYNKATNEIAMVQSRGRARAENSTFELVTGGTEGQKKADKQRMNTLREELMKRAMDTIKSYSRDKYQGFIRKFQVDAADDRRIQKMLQEKKTAVTSKDGQYHIRCRSCKRDLCTANEMRKLAGMHHAVIGDGFESKYRSEAGGGEIHDEFEFVGFIFCAKCNDQLGVIAIYKFVKFPLLKMKAVMIEDPSGAYSTYKQWKKAPFTIKGITKEELQRMVASSVDKM